MSETRSETTEKREGNCYCGKDRNLNIAELLCANCSRWYHESCIGYQAGKLVPFMMNYMFLCKNCSITGLEKFKKSQAAFPQMCITAIANLMQASIKEGAPKSMFSKDREIIPFINNHWETITTMPRLQTQTWHYSIQQALHKDLGTLFICEEAKEKETVSGHPMFGLNSLELTQIKPDYDVLTKIGNLTITNVGGTMTDCKSSKGAKQKAKVGGMGHGKKLSESSLKNLSLNEVLLNKDGCRYNLAEPDPHAPHKAEFESNDWAGKPIPGWLYRTFSPSTVLLALHDRAPELKISEDRLAVTGGKGYCMVRATHAVSQGNWYWEAAVEEMPIGAATRIGFAQQYAKLQAPCGCDKFGYSWRSLQGRSFHEGQSRFYGCPYYKGDVIGFQIILPRSDSVNYIPPTYKDCPLVAFNSNLYYEEKDKVQESLKNLRTLPGSRIICFKNGVCLGEAFVDINAGAYFPAISIKKSATVSVNFGPSFKHDMPEGARGMYERAEVAIVEQTIADMLYLTENDGKLRFDLWCTGMATTTPEREVAEISELATVTTCLEVPRPETSVLTLEQEGSHRTPAWQEENLSQQGVRQFWAERQKGHLEVPCCRPLIHEASEARKFCIVNYKETVKGVKTVFNSIKNKKLGANGLVNLGVTCFINAIMQCLAQSPFFLQGLIETYDKQAIQLPGDPSKAMEQLQVNLDTWAPVTHALARDLTKILYLELISEPVNPKRFIMLLEKQMKMNLNMQQDAHEFLLVLLDSLQEEYELKLNAKIEEAIKPKFTSKEDAKCALQIYEQQARQEAAFGPTTLFQGLVTSTITCDTLKKSEAKTESFSILSLPIASSRKRRGTATEDEPYIEEKTDDVYTLHSCLKEFMTPPCMTDYDCPCKKHPTGGGVHTINTEITEAPKNLILHLKRFKVDYIDYKSNITKINDIVTFPTILNISDFCDTKWKDTGNTVYYLYAVVHHSGTPTGGHYVADVKVRHKLDLSSNLHPEECKTQWVVFDDEETRKTNEMSVMERQAYLLFYERLDYVN